MSVEERRRLMTRIRSFDLTGERRNGVIGDGSKKFLFTKNNRCTYVRNIDHYHRQGDPFPVEDRLGSNGVNRFSSTVPKFV